MGKPGCHLCDDAKKVVQTVCAGLSLPWEQINIEENTEFYECYKHEIPVLLLDGKKAFKYCIREEALRTALIRKMRAERQ